MAKSKTVEHLAQKHAEERVREAALELLERDKSFDDEQFTPPGAISLCIDSKDGVPAGD